MRERVEAADVIRVEVREHHAGDRLRLDSDRARSRDATSSRSRQLEPGEPEKRVPAREPSRRCSPGRLSGVEENETIGVLDQERVDGHRLVAPVVDHVPPDATLSCLGADVACDEAMDPH